LKAEPSTGVHEEVLRWQSWQRLLVAKCVGLLPVAVVPLWQVEQAAVTPVWLKVAGSQAAVLWHVPQSCVVGRCVAVFPVATVPLWQLAQVPLTWVWSMWIVVHDVVT
jgi:hypothetical protein